MIRTKYFVKKVGFVFCAALFATLTGGTTGTQAAEVSVSVGLPSVEIHTEADFEAPLTPHGEWVVVGSYGRCWRPRGIEVGWRPYCNGYWQLTDAGWYWVSDEPWGWATYHYGRWDLSADFGWYWVPQTVWGPSWVSWHEGGGYIGWAPLNPSVRVSGSGFVGFDVSVISPRAYVFVEQRRFLDPVRPTTVVANNTTIINKTVTITKTKVVNNTVINEGPSSAAIEKVSGKKVKALPVQELRHKEEAAVASKKQKPTEAKPEATKHEAKPETKSAEQPTKREAKHEPKAEVERPAKPEVAKPEVTRPVKPETKSAEQPAKREVKPDVERPAKHEAKPETKPAEQPAKQEPATKEQGKENGEKKDHPKKGDEKPSDLPPPSF